MNVHELIDHFVCCHHKMEEAYCIFGTEYRIHRLWALVVSSPWHARRLFEQSFLLPQASCMQNVCAPPSR